MEKEMKTKTKESRKCLYCGMIEGSQTGSEKQIKCNHAFIEPLSIN